MANRNSNLNATSKASPQPLINRKALLEQNFEQFTPEQIVQAGHLNLNAAPYLRKLNRIQTLCGGMGAVMRIISGNPVVADGFDQNDPDSEPPLSDYVIGSLSNMVAELCEMISDDIIMAASKLSDEVPA